MDSVHSRSRNRRSGGRRILRANDRQSTVDSRHSTPILIWLVQDPVTPAPIWAFGNPGGKPNSLTVRQGLAFELWRGHADDMSLEQRREVCENSFGRPPFVLKSRPCWPDGIPIYFRTHWSFCGVKERRLEATMRGRPFTESLTARPRWFLLRDAVGWPEQLADRGERPPGNRQSSPGYD